MASVDEATLTGLLDSFSAMATQMEREVTELSAARRDVDALKGILDAADRSPAAQSAMAALADPEFDAKLARTQAAVALLAIPLERMHAALADATGAPAAAAVAEAMTTTHASRWNAFWTDIDETSRGEFIAAAAAADAGLAGGTGDAALAHVTALAGLDSPRAWVEAQTIPSLFAAIASGRDACWRRNAALADVLEAELDHAAAGVSAAGRAEGASNVARLRAALAALRQLTIRRFATRVLAVTLSDNVTVPHPRALSEAQCLARHALAHPLDSRGAMLRALASRPELEQGFRARERRAAVGCALALTAAVAAVAWACWPAFWPSARVAVDGSNL